MMDGQGPRSPRRLDPAAVREVARAIRLDRYLSVRVTDEQLVTKIIETYRDLTRRPPRSQR